MIDHPIQRAYDSVLFGIADVSVNLRRFHIRVSQQLLDRANFRPGPKQVRRETMTKGVACDVLVQSSLFNR